MRIGVSDHGDSLLFRGNKKNCTRPYETPVLALHRRVRDTLYALYVLQAATALGTFLIAYVVFTILGYDAAFTLAFLSGLLQFVPVVGPSLLAVVEAVAGDLAAAVFVSVVGLVFVGFLSDALIRPRLASLTTGMPASLYFVGFTGGTLTLGIVGVIAGPLVVAVFVEVVDERTTYQETLETGRWRARDPDTDENPDSDRRSRSDVGAEPTDEDTAAGGDDAPGGADPSG
jgi:predicted PurR-regulated permease PerM